MVHHLMHAEVGPAAAKEALKAATKEGAVAQLVATAAQHKGEGCARGLRQTLRDGGGRRR